MAKSYLRGSCSFREAENFLRQEIPNCGISCELSDQTSHRIGDVQITVLVFEKYFMRAGNYASLTVVISGSDGAVGVDLVGAGGRQGLLSLTTWGTEESFVASAEKVLRQHGFR